MSPIRAFLFLSTLVLVSIAINVLQQLSLPIVFSRVSRYYYRRWISFTESLFGALIVFCTWVFSPTTIRIGAASKETWDAMVQDERAKNLLISNHQALVDWWYISS
jgi:1-acyl-sn-glycerol-3-phosphate acyltransferase